MHSAGAGRNQENSPFVLLNQPVGATGGEITDGIGNESIDDRSFGGSWQNLAEKRVRGVPGPHPLQEILRHENRESSQIFSVLIGNPQPNHRGFERLVRQNQPESPQQFVGRADSPRQFALP